MNRAGKMLKVDAEADEDEDAGSVDRGEEGLLEAGGYLDMMYILKQEKDNKKEKEMSQWAGKYSLMCTGYNW